jgi:hypothetical protein
MRAAADGSRSLLCARETNFLNRINRIALSGKSLKTCQAPKSKIFCFSETANQLYKLAIRTTQRGVSRSSRNAGAECGGR